MFSKDEMPPIHLACAATCGFAGGDLRSTNLDSIKDCAMTRGTAVGRTRHRTETRIGLTTGTCDGAERISDTAWNNLSNGERMYYAERILIGKGIPASKSAIRKMARYGKGLNHNS